MAAGHVLGVECVDVATSADFYWSSVAPVLSVSGADTYLVKPVKTVGGWDVQTFKNGLLESSYQAPALSFASCDTSDRFLDVSAYLAAIIVLWVLAFAARALYRFFRVDAHDA